MSQKQFQSRDFISSSQLRQKMTRASAQWLLLWLRIGCGQGKRDWIFPQDAAQDSVCWNKLQHHSHICVARVYLWHLPNKHKRCLSEQPVLNQPIMKPTHVGESDYELTFAQIIWADRLLMINKYKDICIYALTLCICSYCTLYSSLNMNSNTQVPLTTQWVLAERKRACQMSRTCMRWLVWGWYLIMASSLRSQLHWEEPFFEHPNRPAMRMTPGHPAANQEAECWMLKSPWISVLPPCYL